MSHRTSDQLTSDQLTTLLSFVDREESFKKHNWILNEKGRHDVLGGQPQVRETIQYLCDYALANWGRMVQPSNLRGMFARRVGLLRASPTHRTPVHQNGKAQHQPATMFGLTAVELLDKAVEAEVRGASEVAQKLFDLATEL
jgi:hypothetical protein